MRMKRIFVLSHTFLTSVVLSGCPQRDLKPVTSCNTAGVIERIKVNQINQVDLLFVVDNSNSMTDKQVLLASQLPRLVRALTTGKKNPTQPPKILTSPQSKIFE